MNDDPLSSTNRKWCSSNSLNLEEWKQIKNEILLVDDGMQLKSDYAMLGDGNHISENSSLVNLVTVVEGDGEMPRIPSEISLLPLKLDNDHKKSKNTLTLNNKLKIEKAKFNPHPDLEKVDSEGFCSLTNIVLKKLSADSVQTSDGTSFSTNTYDTTTASTASSATAVTDNLETVCLDETEERNVKDVNSNQSKESMEDSETKGSCLSVLLKKLSCRKKKKQ